MELDQRIKEIRANRELKGNIWSFSVITNRVFLWRSKVSRGAYPSALPELQVGKSGLEMLL